MNCVYQLNADTNIPIDEFVVCLSEGAFLRFCMTGKDILVEFSSAEQASMEKSRFIEFIYSLLDHGNNAAGQ